MDRSQLRNLIDSGRAIALDCFAIGKTIPADDAVGMLFKTDVMNKSVLMKKYEPSLPTARQPVIVTTVVYFPYDFENVYEGGESLSFNDVGFHNDLSFKIAKGNTSDDLQQRINADMETLNLIDSMHSLDPFLFKSKAEQREVDSEIHDSYFAISAKEWDKIRLPIREKISKLVSKALGSLGSDDENEAREQYVERFLMKIWEAKDVNGIEPFIKAMQIEEERAPEVFFAWKAVCYYQVRFNDMLEALKTMFQWVGHSQLCFPADFVSVSKEELDQIREKRDILRNKMREGYINAHKVISEYEHSYNQFVDNDRPQTFMSFLENAENSYLLLANHVSIGTHSVNLWKWYVEQYGAELRYTQFKELFDGLNTLYSVDNTATYI
ncbi:MAG: hypothetical protein GKS00_05740 [Alphaproteobacteria bacterium]|nr:hypothetical protein [Alphaproteobacteria bacterium]